MKKQLNYDVLYRLMNGEEVPRKEVVAFILEMEEEAAVRREVREVRMELFGRIMYALCDNRIGRRISIVCMTIKDALTTLCIKFRSIKELVQ